MKTDNQLVVYCDGGARGNPGPAATGFLIKDSRGSTLVAKGELLGRATNNVAEYQAVIKALKWLVKNGRRLFSGCQLKGEIIFFLDSQLVVNQLNGVYKIKNLKMLMFFVDSDNMIGKYNQRFLECLFHS